MTSSGNVEPYEIRYARRAADYLSQLPPQLTARIGTRLEAIALIPGVRLGPSRARGPRRSTRVGEYRVIFAIDESSRSVDVVDVAPRGQAYKRR